MSKSKFIKTLKTLIPAISSPFFFFSFASCSLEVKPEPVIPEGCSIKFVLQPDETIRYGEDSITVEEGSYFVRTNAPTVIKEKNLFNGWSFQPESEQQTEVPTDYVVNNNIEVYPMWKPDTGSETKITGYIDNDWYPLDLNSLCSEESEQKIIVYEKDEQEIKTEIDRSIFNMPISIGDGIPCLPNYFLAFCSAFDSEITFETNSKLVLIGESFLAQCENFNKPLSLPTKLKSVSNNFLGNCSSFNQELILPEKMQVIGSEFLSDCKSFNQDIKFAEQLLNIGENCMLNCDNFTKKVTIDTPSENIEVGQAYSWSGSSSSALIYTQGFSVTGLRKLYFLDRFPTQTKDEPPWRKVTSI